MGVIYVSTTATYQVRGYLSRRGYAEWDAVLRLLRETYNAALDARRGGYRASGKTTSLYDQQREMTMLRAEIPALGLLSVDACRSPLRQVR